MSSRLDASKRADALFRGLFSLIFVVAGIEHLFNTAAVVDKLEKAPLAALANAIAPPTVLVLASGITLLVFGTMLLLGFRTRLASLVLVAVLIPITVTVQIGSVRTIGPLLKNVALLGGLIHFAVVGSGPVSLDALFDRLAGRSAEGDGVRLFGRSVGLGGLAAGGLALVLGVVSSMGCARAAAAEEGHPACAAPARHRAGRAPTGAAAANPAPAGVDHVKGVAFLVRTLPTLKVTLVTSAQMLEGKGYPVDRAEVVVCGKVVPQLIMGSDLEPLLEKATKAGVKVVACGLSLKHAHVDPRSLSTFVSTVPNGLVEMVRLEGEGFEAVTL